MIKALVEMFVGISDEQVSYIHSGGGADMLGLKVKWVFRRQFRRAK